MPDGHRIHALIVVDVQQGFDDPGWGPRNNPDCESNIVSLVAAWRECRWPVVFVRHNSRDPTAPLSPAGPGNAFQSMASNLGYDTKFVIDATHTFDRQDLSGEWVSADEIAGSRP